MRKIRKYVCLFLCICLAAGTYPGGRVKASGLDNVQDVWIPELTNIGTSDVMQYEPIYIDDQQLERLLEDTSPQLLQEITVYRGNYNYSSSYCYSRLSSAQKTVYQEISEKCRYYMDNAVNLEPYGDVAVDFSSSMEFHGLTARQVQDVLIIFLFQNPQYYFVMPGIVYSSYGYYLICYPDFANGMNRADVTSRFLKKVDTWVGEIKSQKTSYHREKWAHDLVCRNVSYEFGTYDQSAYGAVVQEKCVCAGYTKLYAMLCNAAGVETAGLTGSGHAWNSTLLYGSWYNVDTTWDDQETYVSDTFFNRSDEAFESGHGKESYWEGVSPSCPKDYLPFSDMPERSGWRFEAVNLVYGSGIMKGISGTDLFAPDENLTREMFAAMIYRLQGSPSCTYKNIFSDVPDGNYYSIPVVWASGEGILNGYGNSGIFGTHDSIKREDLVTIMYRYASSCRCDVSARASLAGFADGGEVSWYAADAMEWAVASGIITGRSNTGLLDPGGNATRVECAAILQRFVEKYMTQKIK